jgi:hypothetical protein
MPVTFRIRLSGWRVIVTAVFHGAQDREGDNR